MPRFSNVRSLVPQYPVIMAKSLYRRNPLAAIIIGIFALLLVGVILYRAIFGTAPEELTDAPRTVEVANVADLSGGGNTIVVVGDLRAASQADLRAQKTGRVTAVNLKAGDPVRAGAIIAEIENASERARVLSAQGQLQAAQAQLALVEAGARPEDRRAATAASQSAQGNLSQSRLSAVNAYKQAFSAAQTAVEANADNLFRDTESVNPQLVISVQDYATEASIEQERAALSGMLNAWERDAAAFNANSNLESGLVTAQNRLERVKRFIDSLSRVVAAQANRSVSASEIDSQEAVLGAAQSSVSGGNAAVAGARTALLNAASGSAAATAQEQTIESGARTEDLAAARASVTTARGALAGASADLDATRIRAPFAGVVSALSVSLGQYVTMGSPMAVVTNDRGDSYTVETFVTPTDRTRIEVGAPASINSVATGTVTTIAPGVDPLTQKVRVEIAISDVPEDLAAGESVRVAIRTNDTSSQKQAISLPLSALKLSPEGAFVFTVTGSSTLSAKKVEIGQLSGDHVIVESGLSPETEIVVDARGRRDGEVVSVAKEQ